MARSVIAVSAIVAASATTMPECKPMGEIYANGREIAEKMWGDAFTYETNESNAYTMWFFDRVNPNDAVSVAKGHITVGHDQCHLSYFHKDIPGPEPEAFSECHPWKDMPCCSHSTVMTKDKINEGYGAEYHWDRCGPLSSECERFFVQEGCFYECEPSAGYYRRYNASVYDERCDEYAAGYDEAYATANNCAHNTWEMYKMPIKASYWDAMYEACRKDKFCGQGNFFECAATYVDADAAAAAAELERLRQAAEESDDDVKELETEIVALLVLLPSFLLCTCVFILIMVLRERNGKPMFAQKLIDEKPQSGVGAMSYGNTA